MSKLHVALDTETGGLDPKTSDLLTIYIGIADENFKVIDELDLKLKFGNLIKFHNLAYIKIDNSHEYDNPHFEEFFDSV